MVMGSMPHKAIDANMLVSVVLATNISTDGIYLSRSRLMSCTPVQSNATKWLYNQYDLSNPEDKDCVGGVLIQLTGDTSIVKIWLRLGTKTTWFGKPNHDCVILNVILTMTTIFP